jgi:hypothetical protein
MTYIVGLGLTERLRDTKHWQSALEILYRIEVFCRRIFSARLVVLADLLSKRAPLWPADTSRFPGKHSLPHVVVAMDLEHSGQRGANYGVDTAGSVGAT